MAKKTKRMREIEQRMGQPIERILPRMVDEHGLTGTSEKLGVSKATIGYWMLKLNIRTERVALAPGEEIVVTRAA